MKGSNFLSGGQTLENAAARLSAINKLKGGCPWNLSFSWSQALQLPLMDLCKGKGELQLEEMAKLYVAELEIASSAALGTYTPPLPGAGDHIPPGPPSSGARAAASPAMEEKKPWWQFA
jgi:fructose-bisphosphate aldolase class I